MGECWLCSQCNAMNRLLDTLSRHNMCCSVCDGATYIPGTTQIVQSFEWDGATESVAIKTDPQRLSSKTCADSDMLIMGMIRQNQVRTEINFGKISHDVLRVASLFVGGLDYDGWDTLTDSSHFELNTELTVCSRTEHDDGEWKDCFGIRQFGSDRPVRFEWILL